MSDEGRLTELGIVLPYAGLPLNFPIEIEAKVIIRP